MKHGDYIPLKEAFSPIQGNNWIKIGTTFSNNGRHERHHKTCEHE